MIRQQSQNTFVGDDEEMMRRIQEQKAAKMQAAQMKMDTTAQNVDTTPKGDMQTQAGLQAASGAMDLATSKSQGSAGADVAGGAMTGAMSGAALGSIVPGIGTGVGAAVGGVVGGAVGLLKADAAAEQRKRDAEERKYQQLAQIENDKANRIAQSLQTMGSLMAQNMQVQTIRL